jgi:hypothetical protein
MARPRNWVRGLAPLKPGGWPIFGKPSGRPGRPFSLTNKTFGELLKAIAEINSASPSYTTDDSIAGKLRELPQYRDLSKRQLSRKVADAMRWVIDVHSKPSPMGLEFGIWVPSTKSRKIARKEAFAILRDQLKRHNALMAKKQ